MKIGFTNSPFSGNKIVAIYAVAMTAVAGGILLLPAQGPTPNVAYSVFKIGQTSADPAQLATGWKAVGSSCQAANPSQIAQGFGPTVCGYSYRTATHNSITIGGIDWLACRMAGWTNTGALTDRCTSLSTSLTKWIALTSNAVAIPSPNTDCPSGSAACVLTGEYTSGACAANVDSGLARTVAPNPVVAYANDTTNAATAAYTVIKTFTASCTDTAIQKSGLFTASASGVMVFENTFSSTNMVSGDTLQFTWTITV